MPLNLTPTRKDKPVLGFLKKSTSVERTARRLSRDPADRDQPAPLFRTTRSNLAHTEPRQTGL